MKYHHPKSQVRWFNPCQRFPERAPRTRRGPTPPNENPLRCSGTAAIQSMSNQIPSYLFGLAGCGPVVLLLSKQRTFSLIFNLLAPNDALEAAGLEGSLRRVTSLLTLQSSCWVTVSPPGLNGLNGLILDKLMPVFTARPGSGSDLRGVSAGAVPTSLPRMAFKIGTQVLALGW
ncbi:hypothetical protein EYF80_004926 [Liparis tanakae]|uniref:Uncharacterized protein n=1 Tax=Liparis tanakae TaxID=230148 RepID=A0A4Z2J4K8_9TELE|nr:hypothetical protein EYF80_004926 [Liparis tanakae]